TEITSKCARYCVGQSPPIPTQTSEIQFMKQGRVEQRGLLPTQATDDLGWRRLDIERLQFACDGIQAIEGSAVVMLVMALDETGRHTVQRPGTAEKGSDVIVHCKPPLDMADSSSRLRARISAALDAVGSMPASRSRTALRDPTAAS